jgi:general secretion pathway protein M
VNKLFENRLGKILALLMGAAVLIGLQATVVSPLYAFYSDTEQKVRDREDASQRYQNAVRDLSHLRAQAQELRAKVGDHGLLLEGTSDALAAANLESMIKDLVEQEGTKVMRAQTLQPENEGGYRRVGLRLSFSSDLKVLTAVLLGIETARPVLSIRSLELRAAGEDEDQTLSVAMDVYGFRLPS